MFQKKTMDYLHKNYLVNIADGKKICNYNDNHNYVKVTCTKDEMSRFVELHYDFY